MSARPRHNLWKQQHGLENSFSITCCFHRLKRCPIGDRLGFSRDQPIDTSSFLPLSRPLDETGRKGKKVLGATCLFLVAPRKTFFQESIGHGSIPPLPFLSRDYEKGKWKRGRCLSRRQPFPNRRTTSSWPEAQTSGLDTAQ